MQKASQPLITAVENGLRYPVRIKGQVDKPMTLQTRIAYHKVLGVSIAVIDQGKIVWAKGLAILMSRPISVLMKTPCFRRAPLAKSPQPWRR